MSSQNIAALLKQLRKTSKYSANEVVAQLKKYDIDISSKTLYGYESGLSMPNANVFVALCEIYECDNPMNISSNPPPDSADWKLLKKYNSLDPHGKDMVDTVLDKEYIRSTETTPIHRNGIHSISYIKEKNPDLMVNAAHERTDVEFTEKDRQADEDMLD